MDLHRVLAFGVALSVAACGGGVAYFGSTDKPGTIDTSKQPLEALVPLQGCGEVEGYLRARLVAEMNRKVDDQIEQIKANQYGGCYRGAWYPPSVGSSGSAGSGGSSGSSGSTGSGGASSSGGSSSGSSGGGSADQAKESSSTNNQVAGVDEADFIKNDNKYLYVVANKALRIVEAWPPESAKQVAKVPLDGEPRKLFVEGDRALVYVAVPNAAANHDDIGGSSGSGWSGSSSGSYGQGECTYGYECVPSGDGTQTKVLVFDIANRAAPVKLREIALSGSLLSARRIGNAVHTVVVEAAGNIEGLAEYPDSEKFPCDASASASAIRTTMIAAYEDLRQQNLAKIAQANVLATLPSVKEGQGPAIPACQGYFRPNVAEGRTFTSLLSLDLGGDPAMTSATVVSDPGVVYASETGLYMSVPHTRTPYYAWYDSMQSEEQVSTVHKFRIGATPSLTGYEASGIVKGRVLNQFALDEHEGHLRVATTTGHAPDPKTHSTMSVLARQDGWLVVEGKVDNIAPSEDIRSVRFDGSRGFVVTFKKTDPLYVFDLGNPTAPAITGELKIPGFSTYMHMIDAQHLLTIGYDADDQGSFAWFQGVMLQIFDVSNMRDPKLAHKEVIGTRGSSSEALTNHLAFNYYREKNLLALPMTICEGTSGGGNYGDRMTFSGLLVYDVTAAGGFTRRGRVAHPNSAAGTGYDSASCSNWWTNASSEVKRSVIMDSAVYSVSERRVKVNALGNLAADLAEVSLEQ